MKKILALALVLVLAFGMMTTVSAAKIEVSDTDDTKFVGAVLDWEADLEPGEYFDIPVHANGVQLLQGIIIDGYTKGTLYDYFADLVADATNPNDAAVFKAVKKVWDTMDVRVKVSSGYKDIFDDSELVYTDNFKNDKNDGEIDLYLRINCFDELVSVEKYDYEAEIYVAVDGKRQDGTGGWFWTIEGEYGNYVKDLYEDDDYFDGYEGHVGKAKEYIPSIEICGNYELNVFAHVKMPKDKKYYFTASTTGDLKDEPIFDKYKSIEYAYTLKQAGGLNNITGNFIELGDVDSSYYVYGKNSDGTLKYLGRGGELLPWSAKYYISSTKLDLDEELDEEDVPEIEVDVPSFNPSTGI